MAYLGTIEQLRQSGIEWNKINHISWCKVSSARQICLNGYGKIAACLGEDYHVL